MNKIEKLNTISKALALGNEDVDVLWKGYFYIACNLLGIKDRTSVSTLFEWGENGHNWEALWFSESDYMNSTISEIYHDFTDEAIYIADRLSLDRLFRTHWLYNQYKRLIADEIYKNKINYEN